MNERNGKQAGMNAREVVLDLLIQLEKGQEYSHTLIKNVLDKYRYLPVQERAFMKRLAEGSIERRIELDYVIDSFSKTPVKKMKPLIRSLMRMSVYQLLYMDGVPDSAVCNEAVKLAVRRKFQNLKGYINGTLREISRQKTHLVYPNPDKEPIKYASVRYSMPEWLVEKWTEDYGAERTRQILEEMLPVKPVSLRVSPDSSEEERNAWMEQVQKSGVSIRQHPYSKLCFLAENIDQISQIPGFHTGFFTVQDYSSVLAVEAAQIQPGDKILDICAAPGGKSIYAAQKAGKGGTVIARDVSEQKTERIREAAERMRILNLQIQVWDAAQTDETMRESMDVVLADVPCSGLGVMGKKRDIKYRITPEELEAVEELQKRILSASVWYVKPGGTLLYSTCTLNKKENEETAAWICEKFPFEMESIDDCVPPPLRLETTAKGYLQLFPDREKQDGFFLARLKRKKEE